MFRRFVKRFEYDDAKAGKTIFPRGWAGEVNAEVAKAADAAKATIVEKADRAAERAATDVAAAERANAERVAAEKAAADKAAAEKAAADKAAADKAAADKAAADKAGGR